MAEKTAITLRSEEACMVGRMAITSRSEEVCMAEKTATILRSEEACTVGRMATTFESQSDETLARQRIHGKTSGGECGVGWVSK